MNVTWFFVVIQGIGISFCMSLYAQLSIGIIGAGPAGLTAALYCQRAHIKTVVLTGDQLGGQLNDAPDVSNWPGVAPCFGFEIMDVLIDQVRNAGTQLCEDLVTHIDWHSNPYTVYTKESGSYQFDALIIATGAAPRRLGIPGELEYWLKGVSSCSLCDCSLYKDKTVLVIGSPAVSAHEATQLAPYAKTVYRFPLPNTHEIAIHRTKKDIFENIITRDHQKILSIQGNGTHVTDVTILDELTNTQYTIEAQGVFLAIGNNPATDLFADALKLTPQGYIVTGMNQETSLEGVFAAGDVENAQVRQGVVAASRGCIAALGAIQYIRNLQTQN